MKTNQNRTRAAAAGGHSATSSAASKPLADVRVPQIPDKPETGSKYDYYRRSESGRYGLTVEGPQPYETLKRRAQDPSDSAAPARKKKTA